MRSWRLLFFVAISFSGFASPALAQNSAGELCPRAALGSALPDPASLYSKDGALHVEFAYRKFVDARGLTRYCYIYKDGSESPTLRVKAGDRVTITLHNEITADAATDGHSAHAMAGDAGTSSDCAGGPMTVSSTNLHFHGLMIPPVCHQDDTLHTLIQPSSAPFEYSFKIPDDQPPGLYWYHPHVHGFNKVQILGGASGALIVEGIETVNETVSGLPERVIVIRDQELMFPDAQPVMSDNMPPPQVLRDAEGDILNSGTGAGKPAKDLSINYVTVPYPQYQPATLAMRPQEKQFWRVLNASAITYLDLQLLYNDRPQLMGVVAMDGIPINANGNDQQHVLWKGHLLVPPAGRVEFVVKGPKEGLKASLVTRTMDTGPAGENDPTRPLIVITTAANAPEPPTQMPVSPAPLAPLKVAALKGAAPTRTRKLYFSEVPQDPKNPNSPTVFYLTVDGNTPAVFDPNSTAPAIVVKQGDVEDWIVENRTTELHDFHIHQTHFQLLEWNDVPVDEPYLRDTVNVAYWDGKSSVYPKVKLRIDFRDPEIVGTFAYHCHLLEHADGGMMGLVRVEPANERTQATTSSKQEPALPR